MSVERGGVTARFAPTLPVMLLFLATRPAHAQRPMPPAARELSHIDSLIAADAPGAARSRLAEWNRAHASGDTSVTGNIRVRALILEGRLATTWSAAEKAYMGVVLGYPVSPQAPEAMLRLAQGLLAERNARDGVARATAYLQRLVSDYPNSPYRTEGYVWLARAHETAGMTGAACRSLNQAAGMQADTVLARIIAADRGRVCGG